MRTKFLLFIIIALFNQNVLLKAEPAFIESAVDKVVVAGVYLAGIWLSLEVGARVAARQTDRIPCSEQEVGMVLAKVAAEQIGKADSSTCTLLCGDLEAVAESLPEAAVIFDRAVAVAGESPCISDRVDRVGSYLVVIARSSPEAGMILAKAVAEKIDKVHWAVLKAIVKSSSEAAMFLAPMALKKMIDRGVLGDIAISSPKAGLFLAMRVVEKVDEICIYALDGIMRSSLEAGVVLARAAAGEIDKLSGRQLEVMLKTSPEAAMILAKAVAEKIDKVDGSRLSGVAEYSFEAGIILAKAAVGKIDKVDGYGLSAIARSSTEAAMILAKAAVGQIDKIEYSVLWDIARSSQEAAIILWQNYYSLNVYTPSFGHIIHSIGAPGIEAPLVGYAPFSKALTKETELFEGGYYSFYHGQRSKYGFLEDFTKDLMESMFDCGAIADRIRDDFLFIQIPKSLLVSDYDMGNEVYKREVVKQKNMIGGRLNSEFRRLPERLSVNAFLFGNTSNGSSCTYEYVLQNSNINNYDADVYSRLFVPLNIPKAVFDRYRLDILNVQKLHDELLGKKGRLLQIAIPKEEVDDYVYLASPGAYKSSIVISMVSHKKLETVSEFMEQVVGNVASFDKYKLDLASECAIPLTQDYLLDPNSSVKIFAYDFEPKDERRYQEYLAQRQGLAQRIAKDISEVEGDLATSFHGCSRK